MNEKITAIHFAGTLTPRECSVIMKKVFTHLFASGGVTYSQFLFPYADSLLLSDESEDCFFGSHALLWEMPPERLMQSVEAVCGEQIKALSPMITEIELTAASVKTFLSDSTAAETGIGVGNFAALLSGNIRPWVLREHSRCLCSFAEHIARMKGYKVQGFSGGRLIISAEEADTALLARLYESKTGGIAEFIKY